VKLVVDVPLAIAGVGDHDAYREKQYVKNKDCKERPR
jgi:hypothetical protein